MCASNEGHENLRRIEEVERLIYAGPPKDMTKKVDKTCFNYSILTLLQESTHIVPTFFNYSILTLLQESTHIVLTFVNYSILS